LILAFLRLVEGLERVIKEDAADIRKIKEQLALITGALSNIEISDYRAAPSAKLA
jgi:uncharacterized coiled-coil protein SlyX